MHMENYYQETIAEIEQMISGGELSRAWQRLEQEMSMPYVPAEAENALNQIRRDLIFRMAEEKESSEPSVDTLLNRLQGSPQSQLAAASALSERSLRPILDEIRQWLSNEPFPEAAALIVEALAEQRVEEEFVLLRDGVEYTFWGDDVTPAAESGGFRRALSFLQAWLGNDHPDLFAMCRTLLIHEVYLFLPLSYEEEEGMDLALTVVDQVSELMDEGRTAAAIRKKLGRTQN